MRAKGVALSKTAKDTVKTRVQFGVETQYLRHLPYVPLPGSPPLAILPVADNRRDLGKRDLIPRNWDDP